MGKMVEVTCPHCNETRMIQRKNQYASSKKSCKPCALKNAKKYLGTTTFRKRDSV